MFSTLNLIADTERTTLALMYSAFRNTPERMWIVPYRLQSTAVKDISLLCILVQQKASGLGKPQRIC